MSFFRVNERAQLRVQGRGFKHLVAGQAQMMGDDPADQTLANRFSSSVRDR